MLAAKMLSAKKTTTEMIAPRMPAIAIEPKRYQASQPIAPPVAADPISLPSVLRRIAPTAATPTMKNHLVDDAPRGDVGEAALEAVADLDAEFVVVLGDHH
jgi:hypothetical protein